MILDTSYLIDLFGGRQNAFDKGLELTEKRTVQRVPTPVIMELAYGAAYGDVEERRNVQNALRLYPVVHQDEAIAHRAGQLLAQADRAAGGESGIDMIDPMIAAVADLVDEPVLTANTNHFEALGVEVESY